MSISLSVTVGTELPCAFPFAKSTSFEFGTAPSRPIFSSTTSELKYIVSPSLFLAAENFNRKSKIALSRIFQRKFRKPGKIEFRWKIKQTTSSWSFEIFESFSSVQSKWVGFIWVWLCVGSESNKWKSWFFDSHAKKKTADAAKTQWLEFEFSTRSQWSSRLKTRLTTK